MALSASVPGVRLAWESAETRGLVQWIRHSFDRRLPRLSAQGQSQLTLSFARALSAAQANYLALQLGYLGRVSMIFFSFNNYINITFCSVYSNSMTKEVRVDGHRAGLNGILTVYIIYANIRL